MAGHSATRSSVVPIVASSRTIPDPAGRPSAQEDAARAMPFRSGPWKKASAGDAFLISSGRRCQFIMPGSTRMICGKKMNRHISTMVARM